jgi:hypothetical protein
MTEAASTSSKTETSQDVDMSLDSFSTTLTTDEELDDMASVNSGNTITLGNTKFG